MNNPVCILVSFTVAIPVVFSCCMPDRWEGLQGFAEGAVLAGSPHLAEGLYNVSFDAIEKRLFLAGSYTLDGRSTTVIKLADYKSGNQYVVIDGKCTKSSVTPPFPPWTFPPYCIPSDAKKVLSSFFGAGNNKMNIEIYNYMDIGKETSLTVTKGSCIPLMTYTKGQNYVLDKNYFGITLGIRNMTVFDVPKACVNPVHV